MAEGWIGRRGQGMQGKGRGRLTFAADDAETLQRPPLARRCRGTMAAGHPPPASGVDILATAFQATLK